MIRVPRPAADTVLTAAARAALNKRQQSANKLKSGDPKIATAWAKLLSSKPKVEVATALDACFRCKCAYCEGVAAQDIEHFYPKTQYPKRMFVWDNFLRGCKNCNNFKRDQFPLTTTNTPLLLDPCNDDPLDYLVWDFLTGAIGVRPQTGYDARGQATRDLLRLDMEPLREERRKKLALILYLLAQVVNENPLRQETKDRVREELDPRRPWLGMISQLFRRPGAKYSQLIQTARTKLPEIDEWTKSWL